MKKGMELPINMIVIIALAVLILVIITAFTTSQVGGGVSSVSLETAFASSCTLYRNAGCPVNGWSNAAYSSNVQGAGSLTLQSICQKKNFATEAACQNACGCLRVDGVAAGAGSNNQQQAGSQQQQGGNQQLNNPPNQPAGGGSLDGTPGSPIPIQ